VAVGDLSRLLCQALRRSSAAIWTVLNPFLTAILPFQVCIKCYEFGNEACLFNAFESLEPKKAILLLSTYL
jgi:hypothetical protein